MGVMDRLAKFDSSLQRGLDNGFAAVFGGRIVPAEIEELLKQEAQDNVSVTDDDRLIAPNVYAVGVSSKDLENLSKDRDLPANLAEQLMRYIRNQGWVLAGAAVIRIAEESGLRTGQLRVSSYIDQQPDVDNGFDAIESDAPGPGGSHKQQGPHKPRKDQGTLNPGNPNQPGAAAAAAAASAGSAGMFGPQAPNNPFGPGRPPSAAAGASPYQQPNHPSKEDHVSQPNSMNPGGGNAVSLLLQDGSSRTYLVREGSNILGRSNDADFRLPDTGVSRQHAEITWDGNDAVLVDLQSTNGTTVNDTPVDNWLLADGDVITIGHSNIEVRINGRQPH